MLKLKNVFLNTSGNGLWSSREARVKITKIAFDYVDDEGEYASLRVYFPKKFWNVDRHGLIYTDPRFERELRKYLTKRGFAGSDIGYTEQGQQGDNYVSICGGKKFLKSCAKKKTLKVPKPGFFIGA